MKETNKLYEIFPIGAEVSIKDTDLKGIVVALSLSNSMNDEFKYQVVWWDKTTRYEQWLHKHEITNETSKKATIGFKW